MYRKTNILFILTFVMLIVSANLVVGQAVICEYFNTHEAGTIKPKGEFLEMIITLDNTSLIGYQLRDNSSSGNWQPTYTFNANPLWANLRIGTIIVIYFNDYVPNKDIDKSDGFLQVNLGDTQLFTFTGSNKNSSMNIAKSGDLIALLNDSGDLVHCMGHTSSSGSVYEVFQNLPNQKVCHNTAMNDNQSVIVSPGGHINDYISGAYGTKTELTFDATPGFPNSKLCSDFWRTLRDPVWKDPVFNSIKLHKIDSIRLRWNPSIDNPDNAGYLLLRTEGMGWTPDIVPSDGTKYTVGSKIGHALVIDYIDDLTQNEYLDENDIDCDTDYYYFLYAYKFEDDPSKPEDAHGISYNTTNYAMSGKNRIKAPYTPEIYTDNYEKNICEGDSVIIRLKNPHKFDDCTMIWIDDEYLMNGENNDYLVVKNGGKYSIVVENKEGCIKSSNYVNLGFIMEPKVWFEDEDGEKFYSDTTLFCCKDDLPIINAEWGGRYDSIVWYKDNKFFLKDEAKRQISESGVYRLEAYEEECVGHSILLAINIMDVRFRFSEDSLFFDAETDPVKKLIITNLDNSPLPVKKSLIQMPPGFKITKPLSDEFIIPAKDFIEIEITFTSDNPVNVEGVLFLDAPCGKSEEMKLVGRRKDIDKAYPKLSEDELDFGIQAKCKSINEKITISLGVDEYCLIKSYKDNSEGFSLAFQEDLPYNLQNGDIEVTVIFNGTIAKEYSETLQIEYKMYGEDGKLNIKVTGEKTEPILSLDDNSVYFNFEIEGCDASKDTTITVINNQDYDIQIKDNFFVPQIKFIDLPQTITPGEKKNIPVRIKSGKNSSITFKTQPCGINIDREIEIDVSTVAPDIAFDLESDTIDFGRINICENPINDYTVKVTDNGVKGAIDKIENYNNHFKISGISKWDSLHLINEFNVRFESTYEGKYLDSIICLIKSCDVPKILYVKAETYKPAPPTINRDTVDFGVIEVNTYSNPESVIIDNSDINGKNLIIKGFRGLKAPFELANGELPYDLPHGASTNYFFHYFPTDTSKLDTCTIFVEYDSPCDYVQKIFLMGSAYSSKIQSKIEFKIDSSTKAVVNRLQSFSTHITSLNDVKLDDCMIQSMRTILEYDSSVIYVLDVKSGRANQDAIESIKWEEITPSQVQIDMLFSKKTSLNEGELFSVDFLPLLSERLFTKVVPTEINIISDTAEFEAIGVSGDISVSPICDLGTRHLIFNDENFVEIEELIGNNFKLTIYIHESSLTDVRLYNISGQEVSEVCFGILEAGVHSYQLHTDNLPKGCYFLRFKVKETSEIYKILIK